MEVTVCYAVGLPYISNWYVALRSTESSVFYGKTSVDRNTRSAAFNEAIGIPPSADGSIPSSLLIEVHDAGGLFRSNKLGQCVANLTAFPAEGCVVLRPRMDLYKRCNVRVNLGKDATGSKIEFLAPPDFTVEFGIELRCLKGSAKTAAANAIPTEARASPAMPFNVASATGKPPREIDPCVVACSPISSQRGCFKGSDLGSVTPLRANLERAAGNNGSVESLPSSFDVVSVRDAVDREFFVRGSPSASLCSDV